MAERKYWCEINWNTPSYILVQLKRRSLFKTRRYDHLEMIHNNSSRIVTFVILVACILPWHDLLFLFSTYAGIVKFTDFNSNSLNWEVFLKVVDVSLSRSYLTCFVTNKPVCKNTRIKTWNELVFLSNCYTEIVSMNAFIIILNHPKYSSWSTF